MGDLTRLGVHLQHPIVNPDSQTLTPEWQRYFIDLVGGLAGVTTGTGLLVQTAVGEVTVRALTAASSKVAVTNGNGVAGNITVDVVPANIDHNALLNYAANQHINWTSTSSAFSTTGTAATGALGVTGNITVTGTVDGRDVATDGTKLDGIETAADVTDATNVDAAGAVMNSDTSTAAMSFVIDEDNMASDSATKVPTQQSVKAYVDDVGAPDYVLISTATASSSASISFTDLSSTYSAYIVYFDSVVPATDGVNFILRTSTDNGSTYDSGATDYSWGGLVSTEGGTLGSSSSTGTTGFTIYFAAGNDTNESAAGHIKLFNPSKTSLTRIETQASVDLTDGTIQFRHHHGRRNSAADVDAIQFLMSSGNIATGNFYLYGIKA
jgi:hypothetical protein